jgi:hypothetical protein
MPSQAKKHRLARARFREQLWSDVKRFERYAQRLRDIEGPLTAADLWSAALFEREAEHIVRLLGGEEGPRVSAAHPGS